MRHEIVAAIADLPVVAAFIYGSVARDTATAESDIDVFVLLATELPPVRTETVRAAFVDLQRRLGYRPDVNYPVELFTIEDAREALATDEPDDDQREIRHALQDVKIVLVGSAELEDLVTLAGRKP
jgi:predicted nucleotidyltransferase